MTLASNSNKNNLKRLLIVFGRNNGGSFLCVNLNGVKSKEDIKLIVKVKMYIIQEVESYLKEYSPNPQVLNMFLQTIETVQWL